MTALTTTSKLDAAMAAPHGSAGKPPATTPQGDSGFGEMLALARGGEAGPAKPASAPEGEPTASAPTADPADCDVEPTAGRAGNPAEANERHGSSEAAAPPACVHDGPATAADRAATAEDPAAAGAGPEGEAPAHARARASDAPASVTAAASAPAGAPGPSSTGTNAAVAFDAAAGAAAVPGSAGASAAFNPAQPGAAHSLSSSPADPAIGPELRSPAFAPALGARVALLVRDGIREARIQVNPAGLGPVGVRIAVDGHLARVELLAEHAPTRSALEQALPALASALRESGLTLAGGGVFDAARDAGAHRGGGQHGAGAHAAGAQPDAADPGQDDALAAETAHLAAGAAAARGLVDLYA